MKNIAIILARSGSKGLPDKNILPLLAKPLFALPILRYVTVFIYVIGVGVVMFRYKSAFDCVNPRKGNIIEVAKM